MIFTLRRLGCVGMAAFLLAGCKIDLYSDLTEAEANQMLALLMLRKINAEKKIVKGGGVTLRVDENQFVNAVEVLRLTGLPKKKMTTMNDLFPSGQLVTSPVQEQAKITYLKEQQLEEMLRAIDGVVDAQVSIAEGANQARRETPTRSASVFVKYSPEHNFGSRETDIRRLIHDSVIDLSPERISVVMQAADFRYLPEGGFEDGNDHPARTWFDRNRLWLALPLVGLGALAAGGALLYARIRTPRMTR
jgi:type III secretion protein J